VGVKQGVWQMNIHLHIIAARVLNNFGVKGMYREEQAERAWRMRRFFVSPPKRARCWNETRFLVAFQAVFHANKAFCFKPKAADHRNKRMPTARLLCGASNQTALIHVQKKAAESALMPFQKIHLRREFSKNTLYTFGHLQ
jgi:hypothetical protein